MPTRSKGFVVASKSSSPSSSATDSQAGARRTYVLDTSVLLADPGAAKRFAEHEVVLPVVVITELEGKRHHPELGYFARSALRMLDDLRVSHGRLDEPIADRARGWHHPGRAQPHRRRVPAVGLPPR